MADLNPEKNAEELAQDLAVHFTEITNLSSELQPGQIPQSQVGQGLVHLIEVKQVAQRLRKFKNPNSRVEGDLPRHIVNKAAPALAVPLTLIYNYNFVNRSWPSLWK